MLSKLKQDLPASIVVFLVALPLCLGVALASGAPLVSGLIAGIIGGIVVGFLSESHTSVSGPAAGLAAVVLAAITSLGSFDVFLLAVVLAGGIQLVIGIFKGGILADYIPSNVIKGLLAAIGIILILKQIPHAFGLDTDAEEDFSFWQRDGENTFSELLRIADFFAPGAIIISALSIFVLIFWEKTPLKKVKIFPASLFVVVMGIALNQLFLVVSPSLGLASSHLVSIPKIDGVSSLITLPDFASIGKYKVWIMAFTIAVVASIETLLNLEAVEKMDPHKRIASPNKELIAQGIGNMFSGLVGGIPITSVIVRSSVNTNAGAETKMSAILHGVFLFLSVLFISPILNMIPLSSLAAILILIGYKLANIGIFQNMYKKGMNQFIPFVATIVAIVFTDLLLGVLIGLTISIFYILKSNYSNPYLLKSEKLLIDETMVLELPNQVSFLNKAAIKSTLWGIPNNSKVVIDGTYSDFVDNDVVEIIEDYRDTVSKEKGVQLNIVGLQEDYNIKNQVQFVNVLGKEEQQNLYPDEILTILKQGNERFLSGNYNEKYMNNQVNATSKEQNPFAIVLSCIDSRTTTEHVFDLGLGDIFSIRIAGNIVNEDILGSMEFGVEKIGVKLVLVLGHTNCGAVTGACNHVQLGNLTALLEKVNPAIESEKTVTENRTGSNQVFVDKVAEQNILLSIKRIRKESEIISAKEQAGLVRLVGGMYDVESGKVIFYE